MLSFRPTSLVVFDRKRQYFGNGVVHLSKSPDIQSRPHPREKLKCDHTIEFAWKLHMLVTYILSADCLFSPVTDNVHPRKFCINMYIFYISDLILISFFLQMENFIDWASQNYKCRPLSQA
jgi:hypothetical protein